MNVQKKPGNSVGARLFVLSLEMPPAAYVAVTGTVPLWARVWLGTWLSIWFLGTVVAATRQAVNGAS
jgi:hypothetical protein